jgi:hypothetical protein
LSDNFGVYRLIKNIIRFPKFIEMIKNLGCSDIRRILLYVIIQG